MKKIPVALIILLSLIAAASGSGNKGPGQDGRPDTDKLIFPNPHEEICVVRSAAGRSALPCGTRLPPSDPLAAKILAELRLPFHHSVIKLSQCTRNFSKKNQGPNVLYLSGTEGGFPRHGLALLEGGKIQEYPGLNYVDLVLDEKRLAAGDLSIYSHELGHVMMMNVWDHFPERESVKQHVSMGVTDYVIAFFEGWGEHFQRFAHDAIPKYAKSFQAGFDVQNPTRSLWHSHIDEELRIDGVAHNAYIWQKVLPVTEPGSFAPEQLILLEHTSPVFNPTKLRNAQQMLACEGVLATLFYRLSSSPVLGGNYASPSFYESFLLSPLPAGTKPQDVFTPYENVMLKDFWVWNRLNGKVEGGQAIVLEFLKEWAAAFPMDREEVWSIFLATTAGRTVSRDLSRLYEQTAVHGIIGDYQAYSRSSGEFKKALAEWTAKVLSGAASVEACLGPEIWVTNKDFLIRTTLWSEEAKKPLRVNLNTCSVYDLMTFPGITADKAAKIIEGRDEAGFFRSLDEARRSGFDPGPAGAGPPGDQTGLRKPLGYRVPGMDRAELHSDITYKSVDKTDLKMDIYVPPGLAAAARAPIVFFIHGGYLPRAMPLQPKDWGVYQSYGRLAAASGFIGVTFNHRYWGWTREDIERSFGDVLDAIRFVRDHAAAYHADPDQVGLWAFSGGGPHLSLVRRAKLDFVRCLVSFYAILDIAPEARLMSIDPDKEGLAEFSPINDIQDENFGFPAMFIGRAGLDSPVINQAVDRFVARALALNETIEVANHPDGRHGFDIYNDDARSHEIIARAIDFLKAHIGSARPGNRPLPGAGKLQALLLEGKAERARELYQDVIARLPGAKDANSSYAQVISEANLAAVGRGLLAGKRAGAAVGVLGWSVKLHPDSPGAADALAESYEALGQKGAALEQSERALALLPKAKGLDEPSRARIAQSASERIKRLKADMNTLVSSYSTQRVVWLDIGESTTFKLRNGGERRIRLVSVDEQRDSLIHLVRRAEVRVEIDGAPLDLVCMPYVMPTPIAGLRIQADTTSGWKNIEKRVQFSIWDAAAPIVDTTRFVFPIHNHRLFSHGTQAYNEPVHLGAGDDDPTGQMFYHDYGFDLAGFEGGEDIVSAVEGEVVWFWPSREDICSVLVEDHNGVVWEHCHLCAVEPGIVLGAHIVPGQKIGTLGKTGPSGNLAHLHLGTYLRLHDAALHEGESDHPNRRLNLYPWLVTAYQALHPEGLLAVARPHHTVLSGEKVVLDGTNSLAWGGRTIVEYRWVLPDGKAVKQSKAETVFDKPGAYVAELWVKDNKGHEDADFCQIKVFSKENPEKAMPHIYMSYTPTEDIRPGQPVRFRFWMQGKSGGPITVEFDDGTRLENYKSYSEFSRGFNTPGLHIVTARCEVDGKPITQKLKVVVEAAAE